MLQSHHEFLEPGSRLSLSHIHRAGKAPALDAAGSAKKKSRVDVPKHDTT